MPRPLLSVAVAAVAAFAGCASTLPRAGKQNAALTPAPAAPLAPPASAVRWQGVVVFEARQPTPTGASQALAVRPARHVRVQARGAANEVLAETWADAQGRFALDAPATTTALAALAHARLDGHDVAVVTDRAGTAPHELRVAVAATGGEVRLAATDADPGAPAGAFHIADTMLLGLETTRRWTGQSLPPLWVYWGRGVTTNWSFYLGERPARSGRFGIELLGGDPGRQASTDTDEHDEAIMLHELGHFVMDRLTTNSSAGGSHPGGAMLDPGLAWEEGRATWFATAVLRDPRYRDTIGLEPGGRLRVDHDLEAGLAGPRGIGSEASVADVLWDLADGAEGVPDADGDGVALGPAAVLQAMVRLNAVPGAYPCLATYLRALVTGGAIDAAALTRMLAATNQPATLLPSDDVSVWPQDLGLPGRTSGKIDGRTNPAPSGGPARPENGFDALRVYRVHVTQRARLLVDLRIAGSGRPADRLDVDVELRNQRADVIASARGAGDRERISHAVEPGFYMVYVRDGGGGNRASYDLEVHAVPLGQPAAP